MCSNNLYVITSIELVNAKLMSFVAINNNSKFYVGQLLNVASLFRIDRDIDKRISVACKIIYA